MPSTGVVTISRTVGLTGAQAEFVSGLVADIEAAECKNVSLKYTKATRLPPYLVTAPKLRLGVGSEENLIDISVSQFFEILGAFPDLLSSEEAVLDKEAPLETEATARLIWLRRLWFPRTQAWPSRTRKRPPRSRLLRRTLSHLGLDLSLEPQRGLILLR